MQPDIYEIIPAPSDLSPFVRRYMYAETEIGGEVKIRAAPTGFCYIGYIFGGDAWGELDGERFTFPSRFHFAGQVDHRDYLVCYEGTLGHIMAELTPTGAHRLFGLNGTAVVHSCSDLFDVLEEETAQRIAQALRGTRSKQARVDGFTTALRESAKTATAESPVVDQAVQMIETERGCIGLEALCETLAVSPRTLSRQFKKIVGLSPKFYMRVVQFNTAVRLIHDDNETALTELALSCGFFDQAHFIKSMQQFMGLCPRQYQKGHYHMFNAFIAQSRQTACSPLP